MAHPQNIMQKVERRRPEEEGGERREERRRLGISTGGTKRRKKLLRYWRTVREKRESGFGNCKGGSCQLAEEEESANREEEIVKDEGETHEKMEVGAS